MLDWVPPIVVYLVAALLLVAVIYLLSAFLLRKARLALLKKRYENAEMAQTIIEGRIAQGMTPDMVIDAWGQPAAMEEQVMKTKTKREMKYDPKGRNRFGTRVYFENDVVIGWETK